MGMTAEAIKGQLRDPHTVFSHRVRYVNYGGCYYFKPMTAREFLRINVDKAVEHFHASYRNPAEFTVCLVSERAGADMTPRPLALTTEAKCANCGKKLKTKSPFFCFRRGFGCGAVQVVKFLQGPTGPGT